MSFRGRGGGRGRGGFRGGGRGGFRGRGGGRGGYYQDMGPPETVVEVGQCLHPCEGDLVCKSIIEKVPYFNAPIYLENKSQIGKVDEIFGPMQDYYFSVKLLPNMQATSFSTEQKFFIDPMKLLPLMRFLPKPKTPGGIQKRGGRGGARGGGGFGFRGRGRGGGRGGFTPRGRGRGGGRGFGSSRGRGFRGRR